MSKVTDQASETLLTEAGYRHVLSIDESIARDIGLYMAAGTMRELPIDEAMMVEHQKREKMIPFLSQVWPLGYDHAITCGPDVYGLKGGTITVDYKALIALLPVEPLLSFNPTPLSLTAQKA
jgi:hypothetical protein